MDILEEIEQRVIVGDAPLRLLGGGTNSEDLCLEELSASDPDAVRAQHEEHIAAGARLIRTNSSGANQVRLERFGHGNRVNEINWSAAQTAKQAARGKSVYVAGSVGPIETGTGIDRSAVYKEQIGALLDGGVNLVIFEAFADPKDLALALYIKQSLHHCPAICSLCVDQIGNTPSGAALADAFAQLRAADADILGINSDLESSIRFIQAGPLSLFPSSQGTEAPEAPELFTAGAVAMAEAGGRIIGAGHGFNAQHIAAFALALGQG